VNLRTVGRLSVLATGGAVLLATGCSVGPNFTKPEVPVTATWRTANDARIATQKAADSVWWKAFNDPALDRLVELAYQQNLPLQIAGLRILEARAQLGVATGMQFPQSQFLFGKATWIGISQSVPLASIAPRNYGDYQVGFDAAWELDFWGKYRRGVEAETAGVLASVADYYSAIVSVSAEVARTYVVLRTFEALVEKSRENERVQEEGLQIAESRFHNGATSELDPSQATTLLESTRASIPPLQSSAQQARNALSTLLGQPAGTIDALLEGPPGVPKAPASVAVGVPAEMLRRRPDIRSAELSAAAQCARIGVAKAALYPSFSLLGTIGLETTSNTTAPSHKFFSPNSIFYSAGPQINWPFLNYGRLTNAVRVEDARFQETLVGYRDIVLRAVQEVEDALAGFTNAQAALLFQQRAVTSAQRAVQLSLVQYREGAADYQRVLDAQRSLLQQENTLVQTSSSVATNLIGLYKALGGGWESRQGQPAVPEPTQRQMKERTNWGDMLPQPSPPVSAQSSPQGKQVGSLP